MIRKLPKKDRQGATVVELLVSSTLVVTLLGIVAPLSVQGGRLWQETRHQHVALDELSNQLERITSLAGNERDRAIADLNPSAFAKSVLPKVQLDAKSIMDEDGNRISLSIQWERRFPAAPLTLTAWITPQTDAAGKESSGEISTAGKEANQ
jgi:Tfp pilus assembly protein FimT